MQKHIMKKSTQKRILIVEDEKPMARAIVLSNLGQDEDEKRVREMGAAEIKQQSKLYKR
jgi:hypothetical protein